MKILKGIIIGFACLIVIALGIMLYANYSNYTYDKDKTLDQTNQITKDNKVAIRLYVKWAIC